MPRAVEPVRAIGRLEPDGPWVGFQSVGGRFRLVFGLKDGSIVWDPTSGPGPRRTALVAAAMAFYLGATTDPPPDLEATQADLARLVSSLIETTHDSVERETLQEAVDAIDDGLPGELVAGRLAALTDEPTADPSAILRERLRLVRRPR
ncbi:MAG: hypothetical protein ACRDFZ_00360 [Candidatus Limnocylindria bacterium]